jgi:hypothetical protein
MFGGAQIVELCSEAVELLTAPQQLQQRGETSGVGAILLGFAVSCVRFA